MKRPKKPVNNLKEILRDIFYWNVQEVLNYIEEKNIDPTEATIEHNCEGDICLCYYKKEYTEEEFKKRFDKYNKDLQAYNKWYNSKGQKQVNELERTQAELESLKMQIELIEEKLRNIC